MAKQNSQQVLIDLQAEAKAQGASEIKNLSDDILGLAGAGSLSVEVIQSLNYALSTLQSSKGLKGFQNIRNELAGLLKQLKTIMSMTNSKGMTRTSAKQAYSKVYENTVAAVGRTKANNGYALTTEEARITKVLESASLRIDQTTTALLQASEKLSEFASKVSSPEGAKQYATSAAAMTRAAIEIDTNEINKRSKTAAARRNRAIAERQESLNEYLINTGRANDYNAAAVSGRIARAKMQEIQAQIMEDKFFKNKYLGSNFTNNLRMGFGRLETEFHQRRGLTGVVSRFGENLFKNSKFGDVFNQGIAGAGVNLGGIAFGGAAMGIAALGKGIIDLSKASVEAYENIEKVKTQLGVVYGTQGEADSMFGKISQYAIKSPFGVKDVAEQTTILKQSGVAEYELMSVLKSLGDLAGDNTEKMNRLANAVSQIAASGNATARQMRMFTMAGVPIYQAIADVKGIQKNDVRTQITKGNVTYEDIVKALERLTQEGGPFYKAVEKGAKTLAARKQNLADIKELAGFEAAQVKNLGLPGPADISKWWTELQEDFFQGLYGNRKRLRVSASAREAADTEDFLAVLDSRIGSSTNPDEIRYLKVLKMDVESQTVMTKDQREAALSEGYVFANQRMQEAANSLLVAQNLIEKMKQAKTNEETETIVKVLRAMGVKVSLSDTYTDKNGETQYVYKADTRKLEKQYDQARRDFEELSPRARQAAYATGNRAYLKEVNQRPLGTQGQQTLDYVKGLYETSVQAEEERKAQEEEKKQELKDIYEEMKKMGLTDKNSFKFLRGVKDIDTAVSLVGRYTTADSNALTLDKNSKEFNESFQTLTTQLKTLGPVFLGELGRMGRDIKPFSRLMHSILNPTSNESLQEDFAQLKDRIEHLDGPLRDFGRMMVQNRKLLDIDEKYLNFEEKNKGPKENFAFDSAYAQLFRELIDKNLGVSLWRTLGGEFTLNEPGHWYSHSLTRYLNNNMQRDIVGASLGGLLQQKGDKSFSWKDLSALITNSPDRYYKAKNQAVFDSSGERIKGTKWEERNLSIGRFEKGFVNFYSSKTAAESMALSKRATAATTSAVAKSYTTLLDNLDKFFVGTLTEKEREANQEYVKKASQLAQMPENYGEFQFKDKGHYRNAAERQADMEKQRKEYDRLKSAYNREREDIEKKVAQLKATSAYAQIGIEENEEYRLSVTAISHKLSKTNDGLTKYNASSMEVLSAFREEIEATAELTQALADFKTYAEELQKTARTAKNNAIAYGVMGGVQGTEYENAVKRLVEILNNEEYKNTLRSSPEFKGMSDRQIINSLLSRSVTGGNRGYSLSEYSSQILSARDKRNAFYDIFGGDRATFIAKKGIINSTSTLKDYVDKGYITPQDKIEIESGKSNRIGAVYDKYENEMLEAEKSASKADLTNALLGSIISILEDTGVAIRETDTEQYEKGRNKVETEIENFARSKANVLAPDWHTYGENTANQQEILNYYGVSPTAQYKDIIANKFLNRDENGEFILGEKGFEVDIKEYEKLLEKRKELGMDNSWLEMGEDGTISLNSLVEANEEVDDYEKNVDKANKATTKLGTSMLKAFDGAMISALSDSMFAFGQSLADSADSAEAVGKALKDVFANLLKNIGPQMTETGLAIAMGAAKEADGPDWGRVAGGLALAAAGGFLSFSSGLMSGKENKDDDKDAQREARLKSLADILSDLIAQARTDAEYYERNARHRQALSEDYSLSSRSVNDMIITPEGTFSTHPEDTIIAMKHPEELGSKNSSPNVTITIVNQSGDTVKVASTEKREDANGDIDIKATIVAVTADAVASGELDGAFAQMQARQRGVSRTY